ncbi:UNVERIFIED_CONTAM: hypothetical protein Sradi_7061000 [Sesamum radiatum]|uniref:Uncharacterized protein n=1 Tax=Sesamum radiatum TaxID=300843 RepID=A0AAW2J857_SESRA
MRFGASTSLLSTTRVPPIQKTSLVALWPRPRNLYPNGLHPPDQFSFSSRRGWTDPEIPERAASGGISRLLGRRKGAGTAQNCCLPTKARFYNSRIKERTSAIGDPVLRKVEATGKDPGKLGANWEGPYRKDSSFGFIQA